MISTRQIGQIARSVTLMRLLGQETTMLLLALIVVRHQETVAALAETIGVSHDWVRERLDPLERAAIVVVDDASERYAVGTDPLVRALLNTIFTGEA